MQAKTYISLVTIFFILSISSVFMDRAFSQATACNYYASPGGSGNGLSQSSPFKISNFWSVAKAGQTLCLLDGTYTGSASMIIPPANLKGLSGAPITVRALNDGKVLINGQGALRPISLSVNDWFVIEGVNACCSNATVLAMWQSSHNVVRRVIGWDAADDNVFIFGIHEGNYNLLEDVAGWGIARKIFDSSAGGNFTTIRRAWGRWEGSHFSGPKMTYTLAYDNYGMLCENCIGTWSGERMKQTYTLLCPSNPTYSMCGQTFTGGQVDQPQAIFSNDGLTGANKKADAKLLGSIAYIQGSNFPNDYLILLSEMDSVEVTNTVAYLMPGSYTDTKSFILGGMGAPGVTATNLVAGNLTSIGGAGPSISSDWQKSNIVSGAFVGATYGSGENIFNTSRGANLCYGYQNGALTKAPLWPWPMNQRIKDAMTASGRSPVDVTATIESMFGSIPSACKSSGTTTNTTAVSKPSAPINLQAQRQ